MYLLMRRFDMSLQDLLDNHLHSGEGTRLIDLPSLLRALAQVSKESVWLSGQHLLAAGIWL
jgi:hypothetical protein